MRANKSEEEKSLKAQMNLPMKKQRRKQLLPALFYSTVYGLILKDTIRIY